MDRELALDLLRSAQSELKTRYGVESAALFGSMARGDADRDSDIDVAVRFAPDHERDVMALCGVSGLLSGLFQADVDVVALPSRDSALEQSIRHEGVLAF